MHFQIFLILIFLLFLQTCLKSICMYATNIQSYYLYIDLHTKHRLTSYSNNVKKIEMPILRWRICIKQVIDQRLKILLYNILFHT